MIFNNIDGKSKGTQVYNNLLEKPQLNGKTFEGNKKLGDYGDIYLSELVNDTNNVSIQEAQRISEVTRSGLIKPNFRDIVIIPDKYNTGLDKTKILTAPPVSGSFMCGTSENHSDNNALTFSQNDTKYILNYYSNTQMEDICTIKNYDFSKKSLGVQNFTANKGEDENYHKTVIFENCKLNGLATKEAKVTLKFYNCEFEGNIGGTNIEVYNCFLHPFCCDAFNPISDVIVRDSYIADILREPQNTGTHIDGVQTFGDRNIKGKNIRFDNVRFNIPYFKYVKDGGDTYVSSAISTGLEFGPCRDVSFTNLMIDSGSRYFPLYNTVGPKYGSNFLMKDILCSDSYAHLFYQTYISPVTKVSNVEKNHSLYVSSIWKDEMNKTHIICTNNVDRKKTLTVITDKKRYYFPILNYPSPGQLMDNPAYAGYRFADLPCDIDCVIEEDVKYVICYDGTERVRFVNFSTEEVYYDPMDIAERYIEKTYTEQNGIITQNLLPNTFEKITSPVTNLTLTIEPATGYIKYLLEFFTGTDPVTVNLPSGYKWDGEKAPQFKQNTTYHLVLFSGVAYCSNGILQTLI